MVMSTLIGGFLDSFSKYREKRALSFYRNGRKETDITYGQLDLDSNRVARGLLDMGVAKGDRVILFMPKSLFFVVVHMAIQKIGAITVPLNPQFKEAEMRYFINDADPRLIVCGRAQEPMISQLASDRQVLVVDTDVPYQELDRFAHLSDQGVLENLTPDDPALIIYTSGTTGKPKGAVLTHRNLVHDAYNVIHVWEINATDVICHALPLFHVHGLCFAFHTALLAGAGVVMLDQFRPQHVIERLAVRRGEQSCSVFMAVPVMYVRMLDYLGKSKPDFTHIRLWASGSAPLLPKDFHRIRDVFGKEPVEREGMTETGMNFSNPLYGKRKPGSVGIPLPDLEVRIVDPRTQRDVPFGEVGEIWLRGPSITPGYWRKPEETKQAFVDGWFRTGDLGRVDEDGYFYITDRIKHIIISGGENISPKEIENIINQLPEVLESCVVGVPDDKWGEKVAAAVVLRAGGAVEPEDIDRHCKKFLHDWKCPKEILIVKGLPKNTMGKVMKEEVIKMFQAKDTS